MTRLRKETARSTVAAVLLKWIGLCFIITDLWVKQSNRLYTRYIKKSTFARVVKDRLTVRYEGTGLGLSAARRQGVRPEDPAGGAGLELARRGRVLAREGEARAGSGMASWGLGRPGGGVGYVFL
jgi:hypothetical protein